MLLHTISSLKKHLVPDLTVADVPTLQTPRTFSTTSLLERRKNRPSLPLRSAVEKTTTLTAKFTGFTLNTTPGEQLYPST